MVVDATPTMTLDQFAFAKAFADETRCQIMQCLCGEWLSVNDVAQTLGGKVSQPTVSHRLKILADANLALVRQEGRQRFYSLNQAQVTLCCGLLLQNFAPHFQSEIKVLDSTKTT